MIVPDVNLLVYAHNRSSAFHESASRWWEECLNGEIPVLLPSVCLNGFIRIVTHPKIFDEPLRVAEAFDLCDLWITSPMLSLTVPSLGHYEHYKRLLKSVGVAAKLSTDAYIAAIALENQATVFSNDSDFSRFVGVKWTNPLA